MGCVGSKKKKCHHCNTPSSPVPRSYSGQARQNRNQSYHHVSLTSSTLGSLKLDHFHEDEINNSSGNSFCNGNAENAVNKEFLAGIDEVRVWSSLIEDKIPKMDLKTPVTTPPGEPETINTWEIMEGLNISPVRSPAYIRSFSFDVPKKLSPQRPNLARVCSALHSGTDPIWVRMASDDGLHSKAVSCQVSKREKVILYFTSLRGVRKTYEDCCNVRVILKGLGVKIDERDVSMHSGFKEELKQMLGDNFSGLLPRVFVGKKYIGGVEEVQIMHEQGKLEKTVEGCQVVEVGVCEACEDIRFLPCETCYGSCKVFNEEDEYSDKGGEGELGFHRCPDCNENGLIRCQICCD